MPNDRCIKKFYDMLKVSDERGLNDWVRKVRVNLYTNGFGYFGEKQLVTYVKYLYNATGIG